MSTRAIRLAVARIDALASEMPPAAQWLSLAEQQRLGAIRSSSRAAQFLAGRWLTRRLLSLEDSAVRWMLDAPDRGPPHVIAPPGHGGMHASISHSGPWVAAAVSDSPLGVDLEVHTGRERDIAGIAATVCTAGEVARIASGDRVREFHACWTLKEAWLKRRGEDMSPARLAQIDTAPASAGAAPNARLWQWGQVTLALVAPMERPVRWDAMPPCDPAPWVAIDCA